MAIDASESSHGDQKLETRKGKMLLIIGFLIEKHFLVSIPFQQM